MNKLIFIFALSFLASACGSGTDSHGEHADEHGHGHAHIEAAQPDKGPHGGRLLVDGALAVELAIFEDGVPPEYRAWITQDGALLPPHTVKLAVELTRLDGERNTFAFTPTQDFLRSDRVVTEPHSFSVRVRAEHAGATHEWNYDSFEGRVEIPAASAQAAGLEVNSAGPQRIREVLPLYGRIVVKPEAQREVSARFPGLIRKLTRNVGDAVKVGEELAQIESNDSLQTYRLSAPIAGTVTARMAQPGEQAGAEPLFQITDLSQIWAELSVFPRDAAKLAVGQELRLRAVEGEHGARGRVLRIAPSAAAGAMQVWASVEASNAAWTPGLFVNAEVLIGGADVPLAVKTSGLQTFRDHSVVFARVGQTYEVRMLELGRSDGEFVEVLGGLKPGTEYVSANSYLIKADIEKSGASHDH
ncbi:MAG: efflux RND transporter periplasmic adaptor subunit [Panacagrimonas sp.]